jgi:hypothetical protein
VSFAEEFRVQVKTPLGNRGVSNKQKNFDRERNSKCKQRNFNRERNRGISTEKETEEFQQRKKTHGNSKCKQKKYLMK